MMMMMMMVCVCVCVCSRRPPSRAFSLRLCRQMATLTCLKFLLPRFLATEEEVLVVVEVEMLTLMI